MAITGFLGSYVHQVDDKSRINLPASFRRGVPEGTGLVLVQAQPDALTLYPEATWADVQARLLELLRRQPQSRGYVLSRTSNAVEVTPDKQGRILLPQRLLQSVGVKDSALLVGLIDRIEVWEPSRFDQLISEQKPEFEDYANLVFA
jgi:MraZ protein